jgi:UDP-galactopyranose mutase
LKYQERHFVALGAAGRLLARFSYDASRRMVCRTGRAGSYRYGLDIDDCIEQAMVMVQQIKEGGRDHPVPVKPWR